MTNDKGPEQAAEEWVVINKAWDDYESDWVKHGVETFLAGDSNGYQRGKAEAEKLIWDRIMETRLDGPNGIMNLRQAIFGGSDGDK